MALFYQREEGENEINIIFNRWIFYIVSLLLLAFIVLYFVESVLANLVGVIFVLVFTWILVDTWKPNKEIRSAQKMHDVQIKGSYFSFSHPIVVTINKVHK